MSSAARSKGLRRIAAQLGLLLATALLGFGAVPLPALAQPAECTSDLPAGWQVFPNASSGSSESLICNYKVTRNVDGKQFVSGTAITIETYCSASDGTEAFDGKTGDRGLTETKRVDGERLIIEEGEYARTASGKPNPDNPHRDGVFSQFFPDTNFRLFEKEWLALNPQIVATIVVLTSERGAVEEPKRYGVDDAEPVAAAAAKRLAPKRSDCKVPSTIAVPVGATKPQAGGGSTGGGGGGGVPVAPVLIGIGVGGGTLVTVARRKRRRTVPKFTPPRTYGGRSNPWDPDVETQRRRWNKDKLVWDPDTLSWRDPKPSDFVEDLPETPTPIESEIPEDQVPARCMDTYTQYINEQAEARTVNRLIWETQSTLNRSIARFHRNKVRAAAQLGADIVGAVASIGGAAVTAAKAALKPAMAGGARGPNVAALAEEARMRAAKRTADLDAELSAARTKLASSQLEMERSGLSPQRIAESVDEAAKDAARLRRNLADVDSPADLAAKRTALLEEQAKIKAQIKALENEKDVLDEFINFRWESEGAFERRGLHTSFQEKQLDIDRQMQAMTQSHGDDWSKWPPHAKSRFDELDKAKRQVAAESDSAFERFMHGRDGYDPTWPTGQEAANRKAQIERQKTQLQEQARTLENRDRRLDQKMKDAEKTSEAQRSRMDEQRARISSELSEAERRHQAALQDKQRLEALHQAVAKDQDALSALEGQATSHRDKIAELEKHIEDISSGKTPGAVPAVALGAMLAWLAPAAAATALATLLAAKAAQSMGIGMQSPEEIVGILLDNRVEILTLEEEMNRLVPKYETMLTKMKATSTALKQCMSGPTPVTAPWRPGAGGEK